MPLSQRGHPARGFTLVELMVSIAIITLLAALALPVCSRARELAHRATCLSNLRQIGIAFSMYLADWDGAFPNTRDPYLWMGRRWRWPLASYLGENLQGDPAHPRDPLVSSRTPRLLICPSDATAPQKWDSTSYGYSAAFYHTPAQIAAMTTEDLWKLDRFPCITQRESAVAHPAQKVLLAEWLTNHASVKVGWWDWRGARNYLFVDGHARYLPASQLHPAVNGFPDPNLTVGGIAGQDVD
jgi:prepilin-type N-terminal cleavage/methylation domain-containing protein/prepilin-type processing-associated H-X9-DG protein